jgi:hypothetical protein
MADDKDKKKPAPPENPNQGIIFLLLGLFLAAIILGQVSLYITSRGWGNYESIWGAFLSNYFYPVWNYWKVLAVLISIGAFFWTMYSYYMLQQVVNEEENLYGPTPEDTEIEEEMKEKEKNKKWEKVMEHRNSTNPTDWRLAIMEADIILEEVLRSKGFPGETIGEMLKSAKPGDFLTLDAAWEAHKVRNKIAHSGSDFELNEREKERVIGLFESIFKEFGEI